MRAMHKLHRIIVFIKFHAGTKFLVAPVFALLTSCALNDPAVTTPYEQMIPHDIGLHQKVRAELEFITFNISDQLEEPEKFQRSINRNEITYLSEQWKLALIKTFEIANIFDGDPQNKLSLTVTVLGVNVPTIFNNKADIKARYKIKDMKTGVILFSKDIKTNDRIKWHLLRKFGDDGSVSLLEVEELVINENISAFMKLIDVGKLVVTQKTE